MWGDSEACEGVQGRMRGESVCDGECVTESEERLSGCVQ